jgi:hypothetical protein
MTTTSALSLPRRQRGIVLMVALVMLVTITLLAIMTLGSATTEQKIAATSHFHNMAFQGAESAIDDAINGFESNPEDLPAALPGSTPVDRTLDLGTTPVTAAARTSYLGDAPNHKIVGYSMSSNSFAAYHFLIQGTGTVILVNDPKTGVNPSAATAQGVLIIAPGTNN